MSADTGELHLVVTRDELEIMDSIRPALFKLDPYLALKLERAILSTHNRFRQKDGYPKRFLHSFPSKLIRRQLSNKSP